MQKFPSGYLQLDFAQNGLRSLTLRAKKPNRLARPMKSHEQQVMSQLRKYFFHQKVDFKVKIDWQGASNFMRKVFAITRAIPYGEVRTYKAIAEKIGMRKSARAVGQALAKNPLPIIIPCHRVIKSDGSLGGFRWGQQWKQRLLMLEGWKIVQGKLSR